ncbi:MAG: glutamine--tRNA ligase/YqeY domain fusion protein [Candidatus Kinetoplastibacterium crithidii]|nr:glutamine--tRNA ligase/YqeY domain fusion protein [Candidatus Kinetoplastibacterium crithidii]
MDPSKIKPTIQNFLCRIIDDDIKNHCLENRIWSGVPGDAKFQELANKIDTAKIRTRFPPEPNGYLHIGHAKSICLNFGLAEQYGGACHLRFDDTNPAKEEQEYVDSIINAVEWLGFSFIENNKNNLYFASDYFDYMYDFAKALIISGYAYVDEQTSEQIKNTRGSLTEPGINSPWRNRPYKESLELFENMKNGKYTDGQLVLRAKIDMESPNINMRDPIMYRIKHVSHHRTDNKWCIYPMYNWAHPIEDALEGITHSICTLEFEDIRPLYDWFLNKLKELGKIREPLPKQYEFAKLKLSHVVTSKRKLLQLVKEGFVEGWDDPRMPTLLGLKRRGYTPSSIKLFCNRISISKSESIIDYSILEQSLRDDLDPIAPRAICIIDPIKLIITNYPENIKENCYAPINPHDKNIGTRELIFEKEIWIERDDFREIPHERYYRLFPGNIVRLKYAYIIKCTGFLKNEKGEVIEVYAEYLHDTKSGSPGSNKIKVKNTITWLSTSQTQSVIVNLYDRLFYDPEPDSGNKDFLKLINKNSKKTTTALLEPNCFIRNDNNWQFERLGYFALDNKESQNNCYVLNRVVTLKDSWSI